MKTETLQKIFIFVFAVSTIFLTLQLIIGPRIINVFSQINSSLSTTDTPEVVVTAVPNGNAGEEPTSTSSGNDTSLASLLGSILTSVISLIGFATTTVITWRKEKRESSLADMERRKLETELEKSRLELEELKKKSEKKEVKRKTSKK